MPAWRLQFLQSKNAVTYEALATPVTGLVVGGEFVG
jgi:hypothetical protein